MKVVARDILRRGAKFDIAVHTLETATGDRVEREFIDHPGSVVICPVLDDGRIVLIQNFRHTVARMVWELPAGTCEPGEEALLTAQRELEEETGYAASDWRLALAFFACPGATNEWMRLFVARSLRPGVAHPLPDEDLRVEPVPLAQALAMIEQGTICDAKTIVGLWHLERQTHEASGR